MNQLKAIALGGLVAVGAVTAFSSSYILEEGEAGALRSGAETTAVMEPGLHWRAPFITTLNVYNELTTICFDRGEENGASLDEPAFPVKFADTYKVDLNVCFRLQLPMDTDKFLTINRMAKGNYNLVRNTYKSNLTDLMTYTAAQFRGEDFMQGGQNEFINRLIDQAKNGKLITKRVQVEVESELANAGVNDDASKINTGKQLVWKSVVQTDDNGTPLRASFPLSELGVKIIQVTMTGEPVPEKGLAIYMQKKKDRIQARASIIEEQQTERELAKTEKLKGERERIQAKQNMLRQKDAKTINAQTQVELAKKAAEREIVEKEKQAALAKIESAKKLQIASDNENIQKARASAAKHEASAILAKGQAEAKVTAAKYKALGDNKDIYLAEIQRDISQTLYREMSNFKVEMPKNYIAGGQGGELGSNLDVITAFGALGTMEKSITN